MGSRTTPLLPRCLSWSLLTTSLLLLLSLTTPTTTTTATTNTTNDTPREYPEDNNNNNDNNKDNCVLPHPLTRFGSAQDRPAHELTRTFAANYRDCIHYCCQKRRGRCNALLFSPPPQNARSSAEHISCFLYHCRVLSNCSINKTKPGDQIFANIDFVRELLARVLTKTNQTNSAEKESTLENNKKTPTSTMMPRNSEGSVPEKEGGNQNYNSHKNSTATTSRADLNSTVSVHKEAKDSQDSSTSESNKSDYEDEYSGFNYKGVLVTPGAETKESQTGSNAEKGITTTKTPSSAEAQQSTPKTSAGKTHPKSPLPSSGAAGKSNTSGTQSGGKTSGANPTREDATRNQPPETTPSMPRTPDNSGKGSSSHSLSATTPKANSPQSNQTRAESVSQTSPQGVGNVQTRPKPNSAGKPHLLGDSTVKPAVFTVKPGGSTVKPGGSTTPTAIVAPATQNETNATTLPAKPKSPEQQNTTRLPTTHTSESSSTIHNTTNSPEKSAHKSTGTSPSSENHSASGTTVKSSSGSQTSPESSSTDIATDRTPSLHKDATTADASLPLQHSSNPTNRTTAWADVMADQGLTTMAVLITALTLGCFFLIVTVVIVGRRLIDCWRNRKYSQINRDYLIDGMYDE
ncbi:hypothetical protein ACOMHN_014543 [Nucella lapillus]